MQCHVIVLDVNNNIVVGACPVATDWNFADEKMWGQQQQCYVTVAKYEVGKGKGTQGLSTLAWNAASLLLGYPCCIIPHIVRDYGSRDERSLWEKPRRVIRGGLGSLCFLYPLARWINTTFLELYTGTWCLSSMGYPKGYSTILRVILPLRNILHHKNVLMIIQSLGFTAILLYSIAQ